MSQPLAPPDTVMTLAQTARAKLDAGANITAPELAALQGIAVSTVHGLARTGVYPSHQPSGPGGARRFSPEDVATIRRITVAPVPA